MSSSVRNWVVPLAPNGIRKRDKEKERKEKNLKKCRKEKGKKRAKACRKHPEPLKQWYVPSTREKPSVKCPRKARMVKRRLIRRGDIKKRKAPQ